MPSITAAELDRLLTDFTESKLPSAREQLGGTDLHFVRAGSQATLMAGGETLGLITIRTGEVEFDPPLPAGRTGTGRSVSVDDVWAWIIAAWSGKQAR
jgi:hypothetical protein